MTDQTKTIAESNNFIVLNKYTKCDQPDGGYQTEDDLERELLKDCLLYTSPSPRDRG